MKTATLIAALLASVTVAVAAVPPIKYDVESNLQQEQELPDQDFVQGAGVVLQYRIKTAGRYWDLSGLGGRWEGRESDTSTNALQVTATVVTSTTPHYLQFALDDTETGTAVTNWYYRVFITDGGTDYPLGIGSLDIAASTWTGAAAILSNVTAAAYTDAAVATHLAVKATTNSLGHVIVGGGLSVDGDGVLSNPQAAPTWTEVTDKPFTNFSDFTTGTLSAVTWSDYDQSADVAAVSNRVSTNEADIVSLEGATNILNTRIGTAESDILTLEGQVTNFVEKTGDTVTGPILSTIDHLTTAPDADEFPTAGWVRSLAMRGQEWYFTDTTASGYGEKTANFVELSITAQAQFTNSIAEPVLSDTYLAGGVTTQLFGSVRSPITFEIYMNRVGGNASTVIPVHPEIYYVQNGSTNHLGDFQSASQTITATTPTKYTFTVAFVDPMITGSVHIIGYLQSDTVSGTAAGLNIYGGGVYPSHMDISGVPAGETAADVAANLLAHETLSGANDAHGLSNTVALADAALPETDFNSFTGTLGTAAFTESTDYATTGELAVVGAVADAALPKAGGTMTGPLVMTTAETNDPLTIDGVAFYSGETAFVIEQATNTLILNFVRVKMYGELETLGPITTTGTNTATAYAYPSNRRAIAETTTIPTNATYTISSTGAFERVYGFDTGSTNTVTFTLPGPGAGYRSEVDATFTNYLQRTINWPTNAPVPVFIPAAPTSDYARVVFQWNGTNSVTVLNITPGE